jgi:chromate reductase, NAD(P)H dehydrogenase (quinone)
MDTGGRAASGDATAVVLATPDYHGSISSVIKLVVENLGFPSVLARKTCGTAREHTSQHWLASWGIVLPLPVSVANVQHGVRHFRPHTRSFG